MRYASLGAGKRFRPFLVVETAALFGVPRQHALMAGAALECVHCYSLVHDDLPAMDNDELRRGQPTVHKAFDDATAILAGDGLLTFAFDIVARPETHPNPAVRIDLALALARAAGLGGMVGGQMLDLAAEGRFDGGARQRLGAAEVARPHAMTTGALLKFPCRPGRGAGRRREVRRRAGHLTRAPRRLACVGILDPMGACGRRRLGALLAAAGPRAGLRVPNKSGQPACCKGGLPCAIRCAITPAW